MSCGGIDRNSLIYCQGWFLVFQPCSVWDTSGSWLSILSLSGGPVLSQGQQSLGYECHPNSSEWAEDFVVAAPGGWTDLPHPQCTPCSGHAVPCHLQPVRVGWQLCLSAQSASAKGGKEQGKLGGIPQCWGQLPAALRPTCSFRTATIYAYVLPGFS